MARTVDPAAHAVRREAFVDAATRLIQITGYEQMSIQDVLDELQVSRGAFYHYFDSKQALLDAVIDRMVDAALATLAPFLADPTVPAVQKLEGVFRGIAQWKAERKDLVLALLKVWLSDHNAIVREKYRKDVVGRLVPILTDVVRQGQAEGVFTATSADATARAVVALILGTSEAATDLFVARQNKVIPMEVVERYFDGYSEALERILGLPARSFRLADEQVIRMWFE
jgi:AcrR family transcriptional regulator